MHVAQGWMVNPNEELHLQQSAQADLGHRWPLSHGRMSTLAPRLQRRAGESPHVA